MYFPDMASFMDTMVPTHPPLPPPWELDRGPNPRADKRGRATKKCIRRMELAIDKLLEDKEVYRNIYEQEMKLMRHLIRQAGLYGVEVLTADWSVWLVYGTCFAKRIMFLPFIDLFFLPRHFAICAGATSADIDRRTIWSSMNT